MSTQPTEDFIPLVGNDELPSLQENDHMDTTTSSSLVMDYENQEAPVYEKKVPRAAIELQKIFPTLEFDFDKLKNEYGVKLCDEFKKGELIEKVIVKEGEGLVATVGSNIRCK